MKKVISCLIALTLILCGLVSVSAEISPTASTGERIIIVDAYPNPPQGGDTTPSLDNAGKVEVTGEEEVTITAKPKNGYQFVHWEIKFGQFEIIEGDLNTPVLVIRPTGDEDIRLEAIFVKDGETPSEPTTGLTTPPDDDDKSPTTGDPFHTFAIAGAGVLLVSVAAVVLRKKFTA